MPSSVLSGPEEGIASMSIFHAGHNNNNNNKKQKVKHNHRVVVFLLLFFTLLRCFLGFSWDFPDCNFLLKKNSVNVQSP